MIVLSIALMGLFVALFAATNLTLVQRLRSGFANSRKNYNIKNKSRILIIGESETGYRLAANIRSGIKNEDTSLAGFLINKNPVQGKSLFHRNIIGNFDQLETVIVDNKISDAVISDRQENFESIFTLVERCKEQNVKVYVCPEMLPILDQKLKPRKYKGMACLNFSGYNKFYADYGIKRILDFIVALAGLIILSPFMLALSILIKLTSPGPVVFSQTRVGLNGKYFRMYKFRSMYHTSGKDEIREKMMLEFMKLNNVTPKDTKIVDSSRITKLGKLLRKTSLDEFPQLLNVIKGEMSLVGPRPGTPYEIDNYYNWQKKRVNALPGCTGLWQVSGRSSVSFNDSVILDLYYVNNVSFLLDLKLLLKTIPVMIFSYGGR